MTFCGACFAEPWFQRCKSPVGNPQLIQFSREIIDLLKSQPSCLLQISKFIPSYHHHFAKQCRVSDYGFSKLLELLEAVPHVLQVLQRKRQNIMSALHIFVCRSVFFFFSSPTDNRNGHKTFADPHPPSTSQALHTRPSQTAQVSSQ